MKSHIFSFIAGIIVMLGIFFVVPLKLNSNSSAEKAPINWGAQNFHMAINGDFIKDGTRQYSTGAPIELIKNQPLTSFSSQDVTKACFNNASEYEGQIATLSLNIYLTPAARSRFTSILEENTENTLAFNYAFFQIGHFAVDQKSSNVYKEKQGGVIDFGNGITLDVPDFNITATNENIASFMYLVKTLSPASLPPLCPSPTANEPFQYWEELEKRLWSE